MRVLVTGGAGFIGSHLVDRLLRDGHAVHVWDNLSTGSKKNVPRHDNCFFQLLDLKDFNRMLSASNSCRFDCVFHLAAQINLRESFRDPFNDAQNNILNTLNLLSVLRTQMSRDGKIVFASTGGAIYSPKADIPWKEDDLAVPESPYGVSKLSSENYLRVLAPNSSILRLANVYGPRQNPHGEAGVIAIFLDKMLKGESIKIFGTGFQTRDFVYVDDVVDAFIKAMKKDRRGVYNVSTNKRTSVIMITQMLQKLTDTRNLVIENYPAIKGELEHSALDHHKITAQWGWFPQTSLYDGLKKTVAYYL